MRSVPVSASGAITCDAYKGFRLRETSGAARAAVLIHEGTDNNGPVIDVINLAANESAREEYGAHDPIEAGSIYVEVTTGAVSGCIKVG